jgi:phage tail sheath protein FI
MPFQLSPGVNVSEIDLTTIVPAVSTTTAAIAGAFKWGPVNEAHLISTEDELAGLYGKPTANNFETFFTAANFLSYGNQLYVSRAVSSSSNNALAAANTFTSNTAQTGIDIYNLKDYESQYASKEDTNAYWVAKYPGVMGNSLRISVCPTANAYQSLIPVCDGANNYSSNTVANVNIMVGSSYADFATITVGDIRGYGYDTAVRTAAAINLGDYLLMGDSSTGTQYMQVTAKTTPVDTSTVAYSSGYFRVYFADTFKQKSNYISSIANGVFGATNPTVVQRTWEYFNEVAGAPGISDYVNSRTSNTDIRDELHIVIEDIKGAFSGVPGQILEVWPNLSRATNARGEQGGSIYYRDVMNKNSKYVWSTKNIVDSSITTDAFPKLTGSNLLPITYNLVNGADGLDENDISIANLATAYDKFKSAEDIDVSLILAGKARGGTGEQLANYLIDNIAESRRDCVVFISPPSDKVVNTPNNELNNLIDFRNLLRSTSYAVLDSGYKYQYDKYNDVYRWVPMNGDVAGLCVRTDNTRDPWFSPAGFNRGNIKNIIKLAYNPDKAGRDNLYKNGINPIVNFPGQGVVLYGDKTLLSKPSAFDRINVRRLFIVLEKAIAKAAQSSLFEFNDDFTRAAFRNLVEPYLRDIQGRRGIYDFRVVCDTTNNTPEVIDRNEFRGDIYVKPARSINFIQLNFVAVRTGVEFDEIVGKF